MSRTIPFSIASSNLLIDPLRGLTGKDAKINFLKRTESTSYLFESFQHQKEQSNRERWSVPPPSVQLGQQLAHQQGEFEFSCKVQRLTEPDGRLARRADDLVKITKRRDEGVNQFGSGKFPIKTPALWLLNGANLVCVLKVGRPSDRAKMMLPARSLRVEKNAFGFKLPRFIQSPLPKTPNSIVGL
ncbi:MAG TPA: hypothetical protein VFI24_27190 [Pyrinomonadaceae bacterium]|nr:hypothetical protein [Pyrinomonadaceae bacterium]